MAYGEDAFQALIMALEGIRVRLQNDQSAWSWLIGLKGTGGFPHFVPQGWSPELEQRIVSFIEKEVSEFSAEAESKNSSL